MGAPSHSGQRGTDVEEDDKGRGACGAKNSSGLSAALNILRCSTMTAAVYSQKVERVSHRLAPFSPYGTSEVGWPNAAVHSSLDGENRLPRSRTHQPSSCAVHISRAMLIARPPRLPPSAFRLRFFSFLSVPFRVIADARREKIHQRTHAVRHVPAARKYREQAQLDGRILFEYAFHPSCAQGVARDEGRLIRDAEAADRGIEQGISVVGLDAAVRAHPRQLAIDDKRPTRPKGRDITETFVLDQLARMPRPTAPREVIGRGHHHGAARAEAAGDHGVVEFGGHTHGEVHAFGDQIDAAVAEIELDIHNQKRDRKLADHGRQIPDSETQGHGQADVTAYVKSCVGEIALRLFDQREYLPAFF